MVTEVLLSVTNEEIADICDTVYNQCKKKAKSGTLYHSNYENLPCDTEHYTKERRNKICFLDFIPVSCMCCKNRFDAHTCSSLLVKVQNCSCSILAGLIKLMSIIIFVVRTWYYLKRYQYVLD